jgi:hypothetical protein
VIRGQGGPVGGQLIDATTGAAFSGVVLLYVTGSNGTDAFGTQALATINSGVCVDEGNGFFSSTLTAPESNYDVVACTFVGTGAVTATVQYVTESVVSTPSPSAAITGTGVTTAYTLITDAFDELGIFQPGESIPDTDAQFSLRTLNRLIGSWAQQSLTIPAQSREVFDLVANQASYTIGIGGDFDTVRPPNQSSLTRAGLVYPTSPTLEIPLQVLTDDDYVAIPQKALTSTQPYAVYYAPTFAATFGTIYPVPIPDNAANDLVLYLQQPITTFANLTTTYAFPAGYDEALMLALARRLAAPYGRQVSEDLKDRADQALSVIKRSNLKMTAMSNYFSGGQQYDIYSDRVL